MSFYTNTLAAVPETLIRAQMFNAEFSAVQAGFAAVELVTDDVVASRQGQASLLLNLQRYVSTFAPAPGDVDMGGYLMRNGGAPLLAGDLATKAYVDSLVISASAPTWIPTTAAVNKTLIPWESCTVSADGVQVTLPSAPIYGVTRVRIRAAANCNATVVRSGLPIQGINEDMQINGGRWCELQAESAAEGWVIA